MRSDACWRCGVTLSDQEQHRLREIETLTVAEDPRFAAHLDLDRAARQRRRLRWVGWWLQGMGGALALTDADAARGPISLATLLAAIGCGLMLWAAVTAHGLRTFKD